MSTDEYAFWNREYEEDPDTGASTVRTTYYSTAEQITKIKAGYAILEQYYDAAGVQTGEAYFDVNGAPAPLTNDAYVRVEMQRKEDGTTVKYFVNAAGQVVKTQ